MKMLHASWPKTQNIEQKQYYKRFNKDLKWSMLKIFSRFLFCSGHAKRERPLDIQAK